MGPELALAVASIPPDPADPPDPQRPADSGRPAPGNRVLLVISAVIGVALLLPLVVLAIDARDAGWAEISSVLFRARSLTLLEHTVVLAVLVTALAAAIGTAAAWFTERTDLPGRRFWTVLIVLPVAMPDFVVGYAWHTLAPTMDPLTAATLVMTLSTYPLVYLPVAASLRRSDPALEETARGLGVSRTAVFFRVTFPLLRPALVGGALIVVLALLAEYGAFEILRFQTFTTEIFTEFQFNPNGAAALSIPLVLLGLVVLLAESRLPRGVPAARPSTRRASPVPLARSAPAVATGFGVLVALAVAVPVGTLLYWMARSQHSTLPAEATLGQATLSTIAYCAGGALVSVVLALPIAFLTARTGRRLARAIQRSTYTAQALPGVVIALCLVFFAIHFAFPLYESSTLLVIAYGIMCFPLALSCVTTSVAGLPQLLTDMGRSLGRSAPFVFARVTLPLIAPGVIAAFCLVFLTSTTELTATLVLAPLDVQTLTTQFWAFQSESSYGAAAPYGLVLVAISAIPGALLALWFDRGGRVA
jgi:iron(III) transport system permease protein